MAASKNGARETTRRGVVVVCSADCRNRVIQRVVYFFRDFILSFCYKTNNNNNKFSVKDFLCTKSSYQLNGHNYRR